MIWLIFLVIFLFISVAAASLLKRFKEKKLIDVRSINKAAVYVKFINNFKLAEEEERRKRFDRALDHYKIALQMLESTTEQDDLIIQNIDMLKNKIKLLDNRGKKVHNK